MGVMSDKEIKYASKDISQPMIRPFAEGEHRPGVMSYGVTSYGYDVRIGSKFKIFSPIHASEIDPKNFDVRLLEEIELHCPKCDNKGSILEDSGTFKKIIYCDCVKRPKF